MTYELYSWKVGNGDWNFSIFRGDRNSLLTLDSVIDPKTAIHGVQALKKKILALPPGAMLLWHSTAKGSIYKDEHGIIKYPRNEVDKEICAFCKTNKYVIEYWPNAK